MKSKKVTNSIGMFNLIKGMGMIMIVVAHSIVTRSEQMTLLTAVPFLVLMLFGNSLMPAFIMVSGYGFRKMPNKKCIENQSRMMLKPYFYTMLGMASLHVLTRLFIYHSLRKALRQTWYVVGGFLLALPRAMEIHGHTYYNCGAMWYMVAIFLGWILLNAIMEWVPEKYWNAAVAVTVILGWAIGVDRVTVFCLSQSMIAAGLLYVGYRLKHGKVLLGDWVPEHWYYFAAAGVICVVTCIISGKNDNMADGIWNLGFVSIGLWCVVGVGMLYLILLLNNVSFPGKSLLNTIGKNSLLVFGVHTAEMHGMPWYLLRERMAGHPILTDVVIFGVRSVLIAIGVYCIRKIQTRLQARKRAKKKKTGV